MTKRRARSDESGLRGIPGGAGDSLTRPIPPKNAGAKPRPRDSRSAGEHVRKIVLENIVLISKP